MNQLLMKCLLLGGCLLGYLILTNWNPLSKEAIFHEISYNSSFIIKNILTKSDTNNGTLKRLANEIESKINNPAIAYYSKNNEKKDSLAGKKIEFNLFIDKDSFSLIDLQEYYHTQLCDTCKKYTSPQKWNLCVNYSQNKLSHKKILLDTTILLSTKISLPIRDYHNNIDFFCKYPGFLLWMIIVLIQFAIFPCFSYIMLHNIKETHKIIEKQFNKHHKRGTILSTCFVCSIITVIFHLIFLFSFKDMNFHIITSVLFYDNFNQLIAMLFVINYIMASICFAGFSFISAFDNHLDAEKSVKLHSIEPTQEEKSKNENSQAACLKTFESVKKLYNILFNISSIALSIMTLSTGILFSAINDMEFIKKITIDLGYSPFRNDFAIYFSIVNSILLLLFFIPSKLKLAHLENEYIEKGLIAKPISKNENIASFNSYTAFKNVLIASSPLLTSFGQYLFNLLAN